ncbi:hypothetical protein JKF63_05242 [Porcisia hertigi]|uniref:Uncharacterized protein n=1 Tax=Porcisia hertigi TaxID=2761500 RepID=A0A836LE64_9TRYP|nr:hypothetical protein JKF63_05242 [Porcisia hertigi]
MGRAQRGNERLYRCLASEARRLALLFEAASTALQRASEPVVASTVKNAGGLSESAAVSPHSRPLSRENTWKVPTSVGRHPQQTTYCADKHKKHDALAMAADSFTKTEADVTFSMVPERDPVTCNSSFAGGLSAIAASAVRRLCRSVGGADHSTGVGDRANWSTSAHSPVPPARVSIDWFHAWLTTMATAACVTGHGVAAASASIVQQVQAHHSLTSKAAFAQSSTAALPLLPLSDTLSDVEKTLVNAAAACLGLPSRFHWHFPSFGASLTGDASSGGAGRRSDRHCPSQAPLMLWPTAMRTTSGHIVPRSPVSSSHSHSLLTTPLTALPTVATAREVFAKAPTQSPTLSSMAADGGGVLYSTSLEACTVLLHTARTQAITRATGQHNAFAGSECSAHVSNRLVLYCSDQCDALLVRAAQLLGITHIRVIQTVTVKLELPLPTTHSSGTVATGGESCSVNNYAMDVQQLQFRLVEDVSAGMYPLMVVGTFGSCLCGAVDPLIAMGEFCQRLGVWFHIDASHGGAALLAGHNETTVLPQRSAISTQFFGAALLADSVMVPTGLSTALPYAVLPVSPTNRFSPTGCAALFFAHIRKVAWSVQALGEARHCAFNRWITPGMAESDVLRVSPLSHMAGWLFEQHSTGALTTAELSEDTSPPAAQLMPVTSLALAERVGTHQEFVRGVLQAVRGDGRFDASLDASTFGIVCLRWLTAADEATVQLAQAWSRVLEESCHTPAALEDACAASASTHPSDSRCLPIDTEAGEQVIPPVQVFVGLVQLQRRVWIHVSFGPLLDSPEGAPASLVSDERGTAHKSLPGGSVAPTSRRALAYVQHTLNEAASRACTAHGVGSMPGG